MTSDIHQFSVEHWITVTLGGVLSVYSNVGNCVPGSKI